MQPFQQDRLDLMFHWVRKREEARKNKEAGKPRPWTDDRVIQGTRFCCVRRMDDRVSKWLLENWYITGVPKKQQLCNAGMARLVNWPNTLEVMAKAKLNKKWNRDTAIEVLNNIKSTKGGKVFTGAYIINGMAGQDKITTVVNQFEQMYAHPELVNNTSMEMTHSNLQTLSGIGSFIGGQIVADLRHVWAGTWDDRDSWAPLGPGSRRGIAWLVGWDGITDLPALRQSEFNAYMRVLREEFEVNVSSIMNDRRLEQHDIQNVLCETDKYLRLKFGTGRAKNKFAGV